MAARRATSMLPRKPTAVSSGYQRRHSHNAWLQPPSNSRWHHQTVTSSDAGLARHGPADGVLAFHNSCTRVAPVGRLGPTGAA